MPRDSKDDPDAFPIQCPTMACAPLIFIASLKNSLGFSEILWLYRNAERDLRALLQSRLGFLGRRHPIVV